ncbi:MAG: OmpH family outer membrane protein [Paludibacteraceae bacterium]|nr:OmpH family outer membrane protein [Paludibacteraceae bacterium]MBO7233507.1 OmpH family outer membrane protein [Paludibacteraceae bacterium]MBO7258921.1 OmpH family outer membrane protein [Paludibacteraceae bacterium]
MKKIAFLLLCLLPMGAFAQNKLGHINTQELLSVMPERDSIETALSNLAKEYETELSKMTEEYYAKIQEFQQKAETMAASIKEARQSEIMEMEQRIQTFRQQATTDIQRQQEVLMTPVVQKIKTAIDAVGQENGFTYIFDTSAQIVIYQGNGAIDVMPQVKAKLGIK